MGMLLESLEAGEVVPGNEPDQHEPSDLAQQTAGGAPGVRSVDVAACDRQEVFGFHPGDITNMSRRGAYLPRAQGVVGHVMAHLGLKELVGSESLGVYA